MTLQPGSILCLFTLPFVGVNSLYHLTARRPHPQRARYHLINLVLGIFFYLLATVGADQSWGSHPAMTFLRLWLPLIFYWWAYVWAGKTLHLYSPPSFSYDRPLIAAEQRLFGNPSLWLARGRPPWLNEINNFYYWSYYLYTPALGVALHSAGDLIRFEAMALAVCLGYAICYLTYPFTPLWGPRWALVKEGLLPKSEQVLSGYGFTNFMNRIMWSDTAHKGGAMPSAHSSTCIIFMIWCWRVWGTPGAVIGLAIGVPMYIGTVYGRYHYVIDTLVGTLIGLLAIYLADLLMLAG